jgi:2-polyprenyl-6-methoxyphenol hydroxylase-like FAD-dependent oxidoreductase
MIVLSMKWWAKERELNNIDVAVLGGGTAGSLAAAMLGRMGISTILVDIHQVYPVEFRCEKLDGDQVDLLKKTGLVDAVLAAATPMTEIWVARRGYVIGKKQGKHGEPCEYGVAYEDLVNVIRRQIPDSVQFICAKVTKITTSSDRQEITLSNGDTWSTRLIVVATGLNNVVRGAITRSEISKCHSISVGFDLTSKAGFKFQALTYSAEKPGPMGYVSMFPIGSRMRANVFVYHGDIRHPWCQEVRTSPLSALYSVMPRLKRLLGDAVVSSDIQIRPVDLYAARNHEQQPGLVLAGDSFATSDPAAGTGLNKVLTDVDRLCHHIPTWLATPGMGIEKIQTYYSDPVKVACDEWSLGEAFYNRSLASDTTLLWRIRRMGWIGLDMMGISIPQLRLMAASAVR